MGRCDREGIVWHASRASSWHWSPVGVWPAVLISQRCFFSSLFFSFFWPRCHLTVDHRQGLVGQPAVSVTNCHQHCLSSLTGWTDDGHLNGRHHSAHPPPPPNLLYRGIIDIHPLAHLQPPFLCFESFICKRRDKTYGANLQQINSDPRWLSTPDIHSESY